jgi:hypothetical protein
MGYTGGLPIFLIDPRRLSRPRRARALQGQRSVTKPSLRHKSFGQCSHLAAKIRLKGQVMEPNPKKGDTRGPSIRAWQCAVLCRDDPARQLARLISRLQILFL